MTVQRLRPVLIGVALTASAIANPAMAASTEYMMEDCKNNAQIFFQDFEARTERKYEGQRIDGTHAVNGTIHLKGRSEDFQCSYNSAGDTLVDFHAEGKSQPTFAKGGGSPHMSEPTPPAGSGNAKTACMIRVNDNYGGKVADITVTSSEFSQAGTLVMMDAGGETWKCLASNDGQVEELSVVGR